MKGFAITLDALVALSFFLFVMMILATQTYQPKAAGGVYLKQLTLDTITVLEKTGRIEQALGGNSSGMHELIEATPKLACMAVSLEDSRGDTVAAVVKSDCNETAGLDMQISVRPVLYQGETYLLRSESWFRKEPD